MEHLASIFVLVSGLAHAIVNAIFKAGQDKLASRALIEAFSGLLALPLALLVPLPGLAWNWLLLSFAIHVVYLFSLIKAFELSDMSVAYPISRGLAPAIAAVCAVTVFGEAINAATVLGIAFVSGGVVAIGFSQRVNRAALLWALLTATCVAGYTVVDAQGVRAAPSAASYIVWIFILVAGGVAGVFALWRGKIFLLTAAQQWRPGLTAGALSLFGYGLALLAFRIGATPRLASLRETSILFGTAIAVIFLKERLSRLRGAGVAAIAAGAIVLVAAAR